MSARVSRMATLLELFVQHGELTSGGVAAHTGWTHAEAAKACANAKTAGYLIFVGSKVGNQQQAMALTDLAKFRAGVTTAEPRAGQRPAVVTEPAAIAEAAAALILSEPGGLDSDKLADQLGVSSFEVEKALAGDKRFVTCSVFRDGENFVQYRESASARVGNDWTASRVIGATAPAPAQQVLPKSSNARLLGTTPGGTPVVQIDIDAIHRKQRKAEPAEPVVDLESVTESSDLEDADDGDIEQYFCLYSSGELMVNRAGGTRVFFSPEETRALFQWLDRLGGTDLSRLAAAEEEPA